MDTIEKVSSQVNVKEDKLPEALQIMKDKPADVIKPVVVLER